MKKLVRGGAIMSLLSLFVAIVYTQTRPVDAIVIATNSHTSIERNISDTTLINTNNNKQSVNKKTSDNSVDAAPVKETADDKKLVKKTGLVSAKGAGRGAFTATAYCLRGRTAMGHGVRRGIIAADPRVLKLGSTISVNAGQWSGSYLVSDTGGKIKGKKLDIWVPSCSEARKFGRRTVHVN